jgi:hypothetical protein
MRRTKKGEVPSPIVVEGRNELKKENKVTGKNREVGAGLHLQCLQMEGKVGL